MNFHERKKRRKEHFEKYEKGWKERPCTACNGSGYYDHNGSPKCEACNGTGKEKYKPNGNDFIADFICCGVLERMNLGWMKLEDGTRCMPYIRGHSDDNMYRVNNCPSCGKYVRDIMVKP